jgi:hypothetical protein
MNASVDFVLCLRLLAPPSGDPLHTDAASTTAVEPSEPAAAEPEPNAVGPASETSEPDAATKAEAAAMRAEAAAVRAEAAATPRQAVAPQAAPEPPAPRWTDTLRFGAFVDAYSTVNYDFPSPQIQGTRGNDNVIGFALGWAGVDASIDAGVVGGTIQLRFGPRAVRYNGVDATSLELAMRYVKQAYATWRPTLAKGRLALDLGKWDAVHGLENGDSQRNMSYSWPFLFWYGQPFFHTGVRATGEIADPVTLTAFVVNGWNHTLDNNLGKTYGLQLAVAPLDVLTVSVGYITGPEGERRVSVVCEPDTAFDSATGVCVAMAGAAGETVDVDVRHVDHRFRHFGDLVVVGRPHPRLTLALNADVGADQAIVNPVTGEYRSVLWWGSTAVVRWAFVDEWAVAARGDFLQDRDGFMTGTDGLLLGSATLTLDYSPAPSLMLRLENRYDGASQALFRTGAWDLRVFEVTTLLAAIVSVPDLR